MKVVLSVAGVVVILYAIFAIYKGFTGPEISRGVMLGLGVLGFALGAICLGLVDHQSESR